MKRLLSISLAISVFGCAAHEIEYKSDKIIFSLKNEKETFFHYSVDNFIPHRMQNEGVYKTFIVDRVREFKFFYTDDKGLIKVDCPMVEYDDFGNYNCVISM
jgi:hypothetical protein